VVEAGDHWIVLGAVLALEITRDEDPLLFHRGRYGGFAELA
jgi:3-hydroxy-9,10-secoandrosta-1,3,5(10)-triene-9,17-dione monooxygenase reductase component